MFSIYYPDDKKVNIGDILSIGEIQVIVLSVKGPYFWAVNGPSAYKLCVKKV